MADALPFSYHTFMFPFIWNKQFNEKKVKWEVKEFDFFKKEILDETYWKRNTWNQATVVPDYYYGNDEKNKNDKPEPKVDWKINSIEDQLLRYATIQYFHKPVLHAILPSESNVVDIWEFSPKLLRGEGKYIITKTVKENDQPKKYTYKLDLNSICLKLFNTGIGVLIFETENIRYKELADIKRINDFGRRISLPFIPSEGNSINKITADSIEVFIPQISDKIDLSTNFEKEIENIFLNKNESPKMISMYSSTMGIPDFMKNLLLIGKNKDKFEVFTDYHGRCREKQKKALYFPAILDDRMYVCSLVRSDSFIRKIKTHQFNDLTSDEIKGKYPKEIIALIEKKNSDLGGYRYEKLEKVDGSVAGDLYAFIYIDPDDSTCQNRYMQNALLKNSIYDRWIEYGTIHGITHHSLTCITGEAPFLEAKVINPFLTQYIEMALLVLVQRSTIIKLEKDAAELADGIGKKSVTIENKQIKELMDLQESYVAFQNELLFFEVTAQEQGIEIYERLQKEAYIHEEIEKLDSHLEALYEATNVNQDFQFNKWALILAVFALIITVFQAFINPLLTVNFTLINVVLIVCAIIGISISATLYFVKKFSRSK